MALSTFIFIGEAGYKLVKPVSISAWAVALSLIEEAASFDMYLMTLPPFTLLHISVSLIVVGIKLYLGMVCMDYILKYVRSRGLMSFIDGPTVHRPLSRCSNSRIYYTHFCIGLLCTYYVLVCISW